MPVPSRQQNIRALSEHFIAAGFQQSNTSLLQPSKLFHDLSGEDIRSKLLVTNDSIGMEYCLRPEFTIPLCCQYLRSSHVGKGFSVSYFGPVFRCNDSGATEFDQAGVESFGRQDKSAADAEILALCLQATQVAGSVPLQVQIGDAGLFSAFLDGLGLAEVWKVRIERAHRRGKSLKEALSVPRTALAHDHSGVLGALERSDKKSARALVEDLLSIAGIQSVGGRSASEIADRFLEQAALNAPDALPSDKLARLDDFMKIEGNADKALAELRAISAPGNDAFKVAVEEFDARLGFFSAFGLKVEEFEFAMRFSRQLDYYTGFVFEARTGLSKTGPIAIGGGRYDQLLAKLNHGREIPAVGGAIWVEHLWGDLP